MRIDNYYIETNMTRDLTRSDPNMGPENVKLEDIEFEELGQLSEVYEIYGIGDQDIGFSTYNNIFSSKNIKVDDYGIKEIEDDILNLQTADINLESIEYGLEDLVNKLDKNLLSMDISGLVSGIRTSILDLPNRRDFKNVESLKKMEKLGGSLKEELLDFIDLPIESIVYGGRNYKVDGYSNPRLGDTPRPSDLGLRSPIEYNLEDGDLIFKPYIMKELIRFRYKYIKDKDSREKLLRKLELDRERLYFPEEKENLKNNPNLYGSLYMDDNPMDLLIGDDYIINEDDDLGVFNEEDARLLLEKELNNMVLSIGIRREYIAGMVEDLEDIIEGIKDREDNKVNMVEMKLRGDLLKNEILDEKILLNNIRKNHNKELAYQLLK